jgi:manganese/zinc-transporting P-type ATPase C
MVANGLPAKVAATVPTPWRSARLKVAVIAAASAVGPDITIGRIITRVEEAQLDRAPTRRLRWLSSPTAHG